MPSSDLRVLGTSHVAVVVSNLERSERFYLGALGLELIVRRNDESDRHRATWARLDGEQFLAIERGVEGAAKADPSPGLHCLALRIAKADRLHWIERLEAHGVAVERTSPFTIYVRDPDGVLVGLSHYPENVSEES